LDSTHSFGKLLAKGFEVFWYLVWIN
jgi:hypothetical protein